LDLKPSLAVGDPVATPRTSLVASENVQALLLNSIIEYKVRVNREEEQMVIRRSRWLRQGESEEN
jgi:hypothetical protein